MPSDDAAQVYLSCPDKLPTGSSFRTPFAMMAAGDVVAGMSKRRTFFRRALSQDIPVNSRASWRSVRCMTQLEELDHNRFMAMDTVEKSKNVNPYLPMGYSLVPKGKLANVVTCLEMTEKPAPRKVTSIPGLSRKRMEAADPAAYRTLFRLVGEDWMWVSRLVMSDDELTAIIHDPLVEIYVLLADEEPSGMLELDFRQSGQCEVVFFGVAKNLIGTGSGRYLMEEALSIAWSHPIDRLWLHTCHFDHPNALPFYQRSGFKPYAFMIEVAEDPRLTGILPGTAAPHVPIIR